LGAINQAVKRYNQCLLYCEQNGEDMALIQLKKIVAAHPKFLKAWQLLALLYMHSEQYSKARQALRAARKIDTTNEMTLRYMHEMTQFRKRKPRKKASRKEDVVEYNLGNETIIQPKTSAWRELKRKFQLMNMLFGIAIGASVIWFLVAPAVHQARAERTNRQMVEFSERIHSLEAQVSAQTRTLDEYRAGEADTEEAIRTATNTKDSYEALLLVSNQRTSGNYSYVTLADNLLVVNREALGVAGQEIYDSLTGSIFPHAASVRYGQGLESLGVSDYTTAITHLSQAVRMNALHDDGGALLSLALAYRGNGDTEEAIENFRRVLELFPYTERAQTAQENLNQLEQGQGEETGGTEETEGAEE